MANLIKYSNMTPAQQEKARLWAEKWGMTPEEYPLHPILGAITNKHRIIAKIGREAYDIISKGSKNGYVDTYPEITGEVRALYRSEMAKLKADDLPKVRLR